MKKRCVIIGSGLGGLSTGVILAKNGYDVTVLEQGAQIGGCLQCFTRRGVKFETGMHFIGSVDKGQTLARLFNFLNINPTLKLNRLNTSSYDIISINGNRFNFANGKEPFIEQMSAYFPKEKDNIAKYYNLVEKVASASSLHSLSNIQSDIVINTEYQTRSINNVIDNLISDPMLRDVLVGNLPLYAGEKDKTPFSSHAFIMDFYNQSAFRIVGGSDEIAKLLSKNIENFGGRILPNHKVVSIDCDNEKAVSVSVENGARFAADLVISDIHPVQTLKLLDTKLIRPAFRKRINDIRNTTAGFSVYIHFKKDKVPYLNSNFYSFKNSPWNCENYNAQNWPKGYLYMHFCHEPNPTYAQSGVLLSYMSVNDLKKWENTNIGHRGDDYEKFKRDKAEKLLSEAEKDFPNLRANIENYYTSTPLTYRDYTGTQDGSMYGVVKDITLGAIGRVPYRTKIPNMFFVGQNINSHGMLGVLVGSIVACSDIIGAENLYNQISEANK